MTFVSTELLSDLKIREIEKQESTYLKSGEVQLSFNEIMEFNYPQFLKSFTYLTARLPTLLGSVPIYALQVWHASKAHAY